MVKQSTVSMQTTSTSSSSTWIRHQHLPDSAVILLNPSIRQRQCIVPSIFYTQTDSKCCSSHIFTLPESNQVSKLEGAIHNATTKVTADDAQHWFTHMVHNIIRSELALTNAPGLWSSDVKPTDHLAFMHLLQNLQTILSSSGSNICNGRECVWCCCLCQQCGLFAKRKIFLCRMNGHATQEKATNSNQPLITLALSTSKTTPSFQESSSSA